MEQIKTINFKGKEITIKAPSELNIDDALNFKPTEDWFQNMIQQNNLYLDELQFREIFYFGSKPGFVTWDAKVRDHNLSIEEYSLKYGSQRGYYLPGYVFCRGDAVSILPILSCQEDGNTYTAVVEQARVPIAQQSKLEIAAGILSDTTGTVAGAALDEIKQELDINDLGPHNLIDLGALAWGNNNNKWTTGCGAVDEHIISFAFHKNITLQWLKDKNGKQTGENHAGERIKIKIIRLDNLWFNSQDSKALASYCLYQNLIKTGIIDEQLNKLNGNKTCSCTIN